MYIYCHNKNAHSAIPESAFRQFFRVSDKIYDWFCANPVEGYEYKKKYYDKHRFI